MSIEDNVRTDSELLVVIEGIVRSESLKRELYSERSGATIHPVAEADVPGIAAAILDQARRHNVPLPYLMGAVRRESIFDPLALNPNRQRNPNDSWLLYDVGIAQLSGATLVGVLKPGETWRKAFIYQWALDQMGARYRDNLDWAKRTFPQSEPLYVATLAYNAGKTGASNIIRWRASPAKIIAGRRHAAAVMGFTERYRRMLA